MKKLNLITVVLFAIFALTSCQKENVESLTEKTERTFQAEDINLDMEAFKKQFLAKIKNVPIENTDIDYNETKSQIESLQYREALSANARTKYLEFNGFELELFWWGYHFVIPQWMMEEFEKDGNFKEDFLTALDEYAVLAGPLERIISAAVEIAKLQFFLMKEVNQGNGVYLSALWFPSPFLLIPTAITN